MVHATGNAGASPKHYVIQLTGTGAANEVSGQQAASGKGRRTSRDSGDGDRERIPAARAPARSYQEGDGKGTPYHHIGFSLHSFQETVWGGQ